MTKIEENLIRDDNDNNTITIDDDQTEHDMNMNINISKTNNYNDKTINGVLSLSHIARLKCINCAHLIDDIGTAPYHLIEPILMKKTAKSLKQMEIKSPQIIPESEKLWETLLKRDFPDRPLIQFSNLNNGERIKMLSRNIYDKYLNEREIQRKNAVGNLKQLNQKLMALKNKNKVIAINKPLPSTKPKFISKNLKNHQSNTKVFKSSLLQKAREVNKQRVRNYTQVNNNNILRSMDRPPIIRNSLNPTINSSHFANNRIVNNNTNNKNNGNNNNNNNNGLIKISGSNKAKVNNINTIKRNINGSINNDKPKRKMDTDIIRDKLKKSKNSIYIHNFNK